MELVETFVSQLVGRPVELARDGSTERVGRVEDVAIAGASETFPPVTGVYVKARDGVIRYAPFSSVRALTAKAVVLNAEPIDPKQATISPDELLLNKDLQDKQIVDVDGHKVVRVNDLKLAPAGDTLRLVAADVGVAGILRRVGFTSWGRHVLNRAASVGNPQTLISWDALLPLAHDPAEPIRLRVPHDKLERIHPSDLAAMIGELNVSDQKSLVESLDEKVAAEALEQMPAETQLSILEDLKRDRAADIMERMDPDDATDLLAEMDEDTRTDLLRRMEPKEADEVRGLLQHSEETAGGLMTPDFLSLPPGLTVADAFEHIRAAADDAELVYYVYVLDADGHILGVLSLREMIRARPEAPIKDIMITDVVTVPTSASRDEVASTIARYDLMAVPILDDNDRMKGIVTVDDTIDILLPAKLRKMVPRVGKSRSIHHTAEK